MVQPYRFSAEVRSAANSNAEVVVVGGGDGSVSTAAEHILGTGKILGVLPLGTLNHFAQSLLMPAALDDAVRALTHSTPRFVDVGQLGGRVFLNNASIGIYPEAVEMRQEYMDRLGFSKYVAMIWALLQVMRDFPVYELLVESEGVRELIRTPFLFVGNNRYDPQFMSYTKRESLTDGCLSVFYALHTSRSALFRFALNVLLGRLREAPQVEIMETGALIIRSRMRRIRVALDGEVLRMRPPIRIRVLRQSLPVLFPGVKQ
jgi:diacylglycerol kinase family enzyme